MAIRIFGELLYYPEPGCFQEFPSPEELKHHIILSTKPPKEYLESKNSKEKDTASPLKKDHTDSPSRKENDNASPLKKETTTEELCNKNDTQGVSYEVNTFLFIYTVTYLLSNYYFNIKQLASLKNLKLSIWMQYEQMGTRWDKKKLDFIYIFSFLIFFFEFHIL